MLNRIIEAFREAYGTAPDYVVRSPGRVNLIGEHTDYNEGFVFPMGIVYDQWLALRKNGRDEVRWYSRDVDSKDAFSIRDFSKKKRSWIQFPQGVAWALREQGYPLAGFDGYSMGTIPIGSGLSSSAALDLVSCAAFSRAAGFDWDPVAMAKVSRACDNRWIGLNNGIMDQLISAIAEEGKATLIDCRDLSTETFSLPGETVIVILNTNVRHSLVGSEYNDRHAECLRGAEAFGLASLRDLSLERFEAEAPALDPVVRRRVRHVLSENLRTLEAAKAMAANQPERLGLLMNESHESLRVDFEVSCAELDIMSEEARRQLGCYGARMTGGGFGGSVVALVRADAAGEMMAGAAAGYQARTGIQPTVFATRPCKGTSFELN